MAYSPVRDWCKPEEIDFTSLTHIAMGPLQAHGDGSLAFDFYWNNTDGPALARDIARSAHDAGKKAILMLGGAGQGRQIHDAAAAHRAVFVTNLIQAMNDFGYDGLDLDWEENMDWDVLLALATDPRQAAPKAILTLPLAMIKCPCLF